MRCKEVNNELKKFCESKGLPYYGWMKYNLKCFAKRRKEAIRLLIAYNNWYKWTVGCPDCEGKGYALRDNDLVWPNPVCTKCNGFGRVWPTGLSRGVYENGIHMKELAIRTVYCGSVKA